MKHAFGARSRGLTLLEMLLVVTVAGILLAVAGPSFREHLRNTRLMGAANELLAHLRWTHTESVKRNVRLHIKLTQTGNGWCYGISDSGACDCTQANACTVAGQGYNFPSTHYPGVALQTNTPNALLTFEPKRGTVNAGTLFFTGEHGKALNLVVYGFGRQRFRLCTPSGPNALLGHPTC